MWILLAFDMPTETKEERKSYRIFRKLLLSLGFTPLQKSLYTHYHETIETANAQKKKICKQLPKGSFLISIITDQNFNKMTLVEDQTPKEMPQPPLPWLIF